MNDSTYEFSYRSRHSSSISYLVYPKRYVDLCSVKATYRVGYERNTKIRATQANQERIRSKVLRPVKSEKTLGGFLLMAVRKTELMTKTELTSLLNRQNYKSIELFENVNADLIELLKNVKRSDGVRVLVIQK